MNLKAIVSHMVKTKSMIYNQKRDPRHPNDKKAQETLLANDDDWMMLYVDRELFSLLTHYNLPVLN